MNTVGIARVAIVGIGALAPHERAQRDAHQGQRLACALRDETATVERSLLSACALAGRVGGRAQLADRYGYHADEAQFRRGGSRLIVLKPSRGLEGESKMKKQTDLLVWATQVVCLAMGVAACSRGERGSATDAANSVPLPSQVDVAPAAATAGTPSDGVTRPSPAEAQETALPAYTPVVANPSRTSTLPCPAGTQQTSVADALFCRKPAPGALPQREGPYLSFHPTGELASTGRYADNKQTGAWRNFTVGGQLESYEEFAAGKREGLYVTMYPNGKRKSEAHYAAGLLHGTSKLWDDDGSLLAYSSHDHGKAGPSKVFQATKKPPTPAEAEAIMKQLKALGAEPDK